MHCGECGTKNLKDSKFCKECGAKLEAWHRPASLVPEDLTPIPDPINRERLKKLLEMAFWHNQVGNIEGAILACEAALVINANSTTAHSLLASVYEKKGDDERAIQELETVLELNPESEADRARLDLLRRGVRIKAIEPPLWYRWLPPALATRDMPGPADIGDIAAKTSGASGKNGPRIGALAAAVTVLALGYFALRQPTKPEAHISNPVNQVASAASPIPSPTSAVPDLTTPQPSAAPDSAKPETIAPPETDPPVLVGNGPDPFIKQFKQQAEDLFLKKPAAKSNGHAGKSTGKLDDGLPALGLRPLPATVAPAPVNVQTDPTLPVPQHTVVVSRLDGGGRTLPPDTTSQGSPATDGGAPPPTVPASTATPGSHIHISVGDASDQSAPASDSSGDSQQSSAKSPDRYQKSALLLQHKGDYRQAQFAYEKAISGYKTQIASGTNIESAQRAIQACQIGLQICRQYQQ